MDTQIETNDTANMNRREAIKRAGFLLGVTLSTPMITATLNAQSTPGTGALKRGQLRAVSAIADRILPKTDTPGALDVGVPDLIDTLYKSYLTKDEQRTFRRGLTAVNKAAQAAHDKNFVQLEGSQQDSVLKGISESDQPFFRKMREMTISGYFTSEEVMKNVLNYDFIPGMWKGCVDIDEVGNRVWAH